MSQGIGNSSVHPNNYAGSDGASSVMGGRSHGVTHMHSLKGPSHRFEFYGNVHPENLTRASVDFATGDRSVGGRPLRPALNGFGSEDRVPGPE